MADFDLNLDELLAVFSAEAAEQIDALERGLLALESNLEDKALRRELLRLAHTLKGNASCVGLQAITAFAHVYEELFHCADERPVEIDHALIAQLLAGVDVLRRLLENTGEDTLTDSDREILGAITRSVRPVADLLHTPR